MPGRLRKWTTILPALCAWAWLFFSITTIHAAEEPLVSARKLLLTGKYGEAVEQYTALVEKEPTAVVGLARAYSATGKTTEAEQTLKDGLKKHPKTAAIPAELARLAFEQGDYPAAREQATAALKLDPQQLQALWFSTELLRVEGKLKEAEQGYQKLIDLYNQMPAEKLKDPETLYWIGQGAGQFARWKRLHDQFDFLVNTLYPDALAVDPTYWPARLESGLLFLEKYNQAEAGKDLKAALILNPNAAQVHAALAELALQNYDLAEAKKSLDRALQISPRLLRAQQLRGEWQLANFDPEQAVAVLEEARKLNPLDDVTLGKLAAAYAGVDGVQETAQGRAAKLAEEVEKRNPKAGEFYFAFAQGLDTLRKYPAAAHYYELAMQRMPQLIEAKGHLGLMQMRLGQEVEADKLLKQSFADDPFNVRVNNTLKVLEVLSGYAVLESEHFILKFDRGTDEVFARAASRFLEEDVYPDLTKKLGYVPKDKTLMEFFSRAKNTDGHGWFSARMVGLPYIGTVGACAGKMVALTSPNDMPKKFNWARVLKHEYVHVLNLQQTNFNIPHWFTEALAVYNEGYPKPPEWYPLLAQRYYRKELFNLDSINLGFIRPSSSNDWTMAYCQAVLYAEYMVERFGADVHAKMLTAYADNLKTSAAIERSFGVKQDDFEKGYQAFVEKVVKSVGPPDKQKAERTFAELTQLAQDKPDDLDVQAELAVEYVRRKDYPKARELAVAVLKKQPKQPLATYVSARLKLLVGEDDEALAMLEGALDKNAPQENVLGLLAGLKFKAEKFDAAAELYELGAKHAPNDPQWPKLLVKTYLIAKQNDKLAPWLAKLAEGDSDDVPIRKKLAELALAKQEYADAAQWATQATHIDVLDAGSHKMLGQARCGLKEFERGAAAYELAIRLQPDDLETSLALAEAYLESKQAAKARPLLEKILKAEPDNEAAKKLLEKLGP